MIYFIYIIITINCLYENRLLSLAHDCFYDFSPNPIKQLFKKYDCNYNLRRKLTFLLPKPKSELLRKSTCYKAIGILLKITHVLSQAEVCLKTLSNVEFHVNSLLIFICK